MTASDAHVLAGSPVRQTAEAPPIDELRETAENHDWRQPEVRARSQETVTIVAHDVGGVGGMERQLAALITRLLDSGIGVTVVSRTLELPPHPYLRWRRVPGPGRPVALGYPWFALVGTVMLIRRRSGPLHTTGAIVFNRAEVCTVHYVHNGQGGTLTRTRRDTFPYRLNAALVRVMSRLGERLVYSSPSRSNTLIAVSEQVAGELRAAFPTRAGAIHVIENGVDTEQFRPDEGARRAVRQTLGIGEGVPLALFLGSDWRRKGADIAVAALVKAPSWHLAVVGRGAAAELRELAERLGVASRVHLVGETPEPERYYAAADAFLLPSAYESFSLAAFEAAACGLPGIATRVGAIAEIVEGGGALFVDRSSESFAAALRTFEANPERRAVMAERARTCIRRHGWDAIAERYLTSYRQADRTETGTNGTVATP